MAKPIEKPFPVEFKDTYVPDFHEVKKGLQIFEIYLSGCLFLTFSSIGWDEEEFRDRISGCHHVPRPHPVTMGFSSTW